MDADLVGAAGFQPAGQQARDRLAVGARVAFQHLPMGDGFAAALRAPPSCRGRGGGGRSARRWCRAAGPARPRRRRDSRAASGPVRPWSANWAAERAMRAVGLGHHHQAGGVLVEAVHDAGPLARRRCPRGSSPQWAISALTSVPVQLPAAGWTTSPAGLSMTMSSSSSYTTSSGMFSARRCRLLGRRQRRCGWRRRR